MTITLVASVATTVLLLLMMMMMRRRRITVAHKSCWCRARPCRPLRTAPDPRWQVLSGELLFLVAGILRRCGAVAAVAGVVGQEAHAHRKFGWERLGLALVPAAWILLQVRATVTLGIASPTVVSPSLAVARVPVTYHRPTLCLPQAVPMVMVLAYARLPHGHRLHSTLVRQAWRAHYALIVFVCATMVNAAAIHHRGPAHLDLPHEEKFAHALQHASERLVPF